MSSMARHTSGMSVSTAPSKQLVKVLAADRVRIVLDDVLGRVEFRVASGGGGGGGRDAPSVASEASPRGCVFTRSG
jgi:hypothetical protein